ncbi:MAG TPA: helix-turn-helix transcriptional regulator [Microthrixaceae bacterium]|nr:helix-turn-helix transcriptional regulator [Microthrixaceae bacterium]
MKEDLDRRWHDLGEFIREQRNVGQMSLRKLSEAAGVSNPYLSQIERGLRRPSAEILQQIARALEISSETLYVRAGILDEPTGQVDPIAEIRRDPSITEEQKKTLVRIYQSFRRENELDGGAGSGPDGGPDGGSDEPDPDGSSDPSDVTVAS